MELALQAVNTAGQLPATFGFLQHQGAMTTELLTQPGAVQLRQLWFKATVCVTVSR